MSEYNGRRIAVAGFTAMLIGVPACSAFNGLVDGVRDASLVQVQKKTTVQTKVNVPPEVKYVATLNEHKFVEFAAAVAVTSTLTNTWTATTNVLGNEIKIPYTATNTATYNAKLKAAKEKNQPINPADVDLIKIQGSFGPSVKVTYRADAKRVADRAPGETGPHILSYVIEGSDLSFTPVMTDDPLSRADSTVTTADIPSKVVGGLDSMKSIWGDGTQTFDEGASNAARETAVADGVKKIIDECGPVIMNSSQTKPLIEDAVQTYAVQEYNATHPASEQISKQDVDAEVEDINAATFVSPWTKTVEQKMADHIARAAAQGDILNPVSSVVTTEKCTISETDLGILNGGGVK